MNLINPLRKEENYTDVSCLTLLAEVKNGKLKGTLEAVARLSKAGSLKGNSVTRYIIV